MTLTQMRLKELLDYDPQTGLFSWRAGRHGGKVAGVTTEYGYVRIKIGPKRHMAHRLAWLFIFGEFPAQSIDHIDGNRAANRIDNLRLASRAQQGMNTKLRSDNKFGLKGAHARKDRKSIAAVIAINGKQKTLGYFKTAEAAHLAYAAAAETHFGNYRRLS